MGHLHQGDHPAGPGAWPYHHPQFGWHMHPRHPGPGWLPLNPTDAQGIVGGGQQADNPNQQNPGGPDPNAPPKETGGGAQPSDDTVLRSPASAPRMSTTTPGRASKCGIDPNVASAKSWPKKAAKGRR